MEDICFVWDDNKAAGNLKKHGIAFEEAVTVFYDDGARIIPDPDHSEDEDRFILLGVSSLFRMLIVCHCYRDSDQIRIISARRATKHEQRQYRKFCI